MPDDIRIGIAHFRASDGLLLDASGNEIHLRAQSSKALAFLMSRRGKLVSKDQLVEAVWSVPIVTDESVSQCIADIRRAIGDKDRSILQTMPKKGYRLSDEKDAARSIRNSSIALVAVAVCAFIAIAAFYYNAAKSQPSGRAPVVAVLPFADLSPTSHRGYLSDAISEGIITNLARYPELTVIARNSSFKFRGKNADVRDIGTTLGADYVLEGSQQYDGANLRVTAQLINARENAHVWADSMDAPLQDLFEVNSRISNQVADAVGTAIIDSGVPPHGEGEVSALLLANQGRRLITNHLSRENWEKSMALNEMAMKEFPDAPWGYIGQAFMLRNGVRWGWTSEPKDMVLAKAIELALRAIELAPENYMAHLALGRVYMQSGDMGRAIKEMEKAAELNPSSALVLAGLSQPYLYLGKMDEVFDLVKRAEAIDPLHDRMLTWAKAWAYWQTGKCEEALKAMQSMSEQPVESFKLLAVIHTCLGNRSRAKEVLAAYMAKNPGWSLAREYELNAKNWTAQGVLDRWLENLRSAGMPES